MVRPIKGKEMECVPPYLQIPAKVKKLLEKNDAVVLYQGRPTPLNEKSTFCFDVNKGGRFEVYLNENRRTGYQYHVKYDKETFEIIKDEFVFIPPSTPGAPGVRHVAFRPKVTESGFSPITFTYKRGEDVAKTLRMEVSVGHPIVAL